MRVKRVFRYIERARKFGITYPATNSRRVLQCYNDADFRGCRKTGRSTSGSEIIYAGGASSWLSQMQIAVATSTTKAEVIAASETDK